MRFYHNIEHIMARIDPEQVLQTLGIKYVKRKGNHIIGWCPDHHVFTGRFPSHPKWYLDVLTGKTYCFTESRGSNLVFTVARMLDVSKSDAFELITQGLKSAPSRIRYALEQREKIKYVEKKEVDPKENKTLQSVVPLIKEGYLGEDAKAFFARDGIREDFVQEFGIVEVQKGRYKGRVLIPFRDHKSGELMGFVAVCMQKEKEWVRTRLRQFMKKRGKSQLPYKQVKESILYLRENYRKALYCPGCHTGIHLFGLRALIETGAELNPMILVEGERDTLKLQQEGFNAVGTHGTHLTDDQCSVLENAGVKTLLVAFDGDEPGRRAEKKIVTDNSGRFNIHGLQIPWGLDPKNHDQNSFSELLSKVETKPQEQTVKLTEFGTNLSERIKRWRTDSEQ